jgi:hypothetical protein
MLTKEGTMAKPVRAAGKAVQKQVRKHPAETGTLSLAAVVGAVVGLFNIHLEPGQITSLAVLVGAVPFGITKLVEWRRARKAERESYATLE